MANNMNLHKSPLFEEAIIAAASYFNINETYIEKDYWVTYVLKNLAESKFLESLVFKGGTSLSKVYNCIDRFSEDIDLAILGDEKLGDSTRKNLMKDIETTITDGLELIKDHPQTEKRGRNRKTFYNYPKKSTKENKGIIKEVIQLEINSFTNPAPYELKPIESILAQYFREKSLTDLIETYNLKPFIVQVLSIERTLFEKVLSLVRISYESTDKLKSKIRHFYDITRILSNPAYADLLNYSGIKVFKQALNDDKLNSTFQGEWLNKPLHESPLIQNFEDIWLELSSTFKRELKELVWTNELPTDEEVKSAFLTVRLFLIEAEYIN